MFINYEDFQDKFRLCGVGVFCQSGRVKRYTGIDVELG